MKYINYDALVNQMRNEKPYRKSTNRYPLFSRRQNNKFFFHENDSDGSPMLRIIYGHSWRSTNVTKEEYETHKDDENSPYSEYPVHEYKNGNYVEVGKRWVKGEKTANELGIVRPDNSFEFTKSNYWQGDQMFMSVCSQGTFFCDSRRGGMIYACRRTGVMYPVYVGMKVDCNTMMPDPSHEYRLIGLRVDRKKAKEILKPYEDFFLTASTMMKVMPVHTFFEIGKELIETTKVETSYWLSENSQKLMREKFEELMNDSPVDAAAAFCLSNSNVRSLGDYYHKVIRMDSYPTFNETAEMYFDIMKRHLVKEIYKSNAHLMKEVEFKYGEVYPPSEWAYELYVDGKEVEICS